MNYTKNEAVTLSWYGRYDLMRAWVGKVALLASTLMVGCSLFAQKPVPYPYVREADVMWEKRIWRIIPRGEKINHKLFDTIQHNGKTYSLWDLVVHALEKEPGALTLYQVVSPKNVNQQDGDQFRYPLRFNGQGDTSYFSQLKEFLFTYTESTEPYKVLLPDGSFGDSLLKDASGKLIPDKNGYAQLVYPPSQWIKITNAEIVEWELKEDWFFDKQRSVMDVRIIGISPRVAQIDPATGNRMGTHNLFWIYFSEFRQILKNYTVYHQKNQAQYLTFDDVFFKRYFDSYILKESSTFDNKSTDALHGIDALIESERIRKKMMEAESDLWEY